MTLIFIDVALMILPFLPVVVAAFFIATRKGFGSKTSWDIRDSEPMTNRLMKASVEVLFPVGNPEANIQTIYGFGQRKAQRSGDAMIFRSKSGWRYGFLVGFAVIFYLLVYEGLHTPTAWVAFFGITGGLLWLGMYIWTFRLEIEGSTLRYMDLTFANRAQDLAHLARAEDFGDSYKLHFDGGASVFIPRYIEGHETLNRMIVETLRINGR